MCGTWREISKARLKCDEYAVFEMRLYDMYWFGPDGMWDRAEPLPLDKFMIEVCTWYTDRWGSTVAGEASDVKLRIEFNNRDEANKMWLFLKKNSPTLDELKKIGFKSRR